MRHLPKTINTFGIWTPYTNYRFKEFHDLLLKNGDIILNAYPNGVGWDLRGEDEKSWNAFNQYREQYNRNWIHDDDVVAVRLLTDEDILERKLEWLTGEDRLDRINRYHGEGKECIIISKNDLIKDGVLRDFINEMREICVTDGQTQQLRERISELTKKTFNRFFYSERKK